MQKLILSTIMLSLSVIACDKRDATSNANSSDITPAPSIVTESPAAIPGSSSMVARTYRPSNENFPNPERGFTPTFYVDYPDATPWDFCEQGNNFAMYNYAAWTPKLEAGALKSFRAKGSSLVEMRYHIFEFRQKPFSPAFLTRLQADFDTARNAGFKLIPRFAYNWPKGGPDASRNQIVAHLEQLKPILQKNVDVLAFMPLGFVGCWGELQSSSNGHVDASKGYRRLTSGFRQIIDKAFAVLPAERMLVVRYPNYKFQYFNGAPNATPVRDETPIAPVSASEAFSGSIKSRWGQHDDGLISGEYNGTWWSPLENPQAVRDFLRNDNRYVIQHGEPADEGDGGGELTGNSDLDGDGYAGLGSYSKCERVLKLFALERFSSFNSTYDSGGENAVAYKAWRAQGCYETIAKKLGYRLELLRSEFPNAIKAGGLLKGNFVIRNVGWAAPYNPRGLELILRHQVTGKIQRLNLLQARQKRFDPRFWLPDEGQIKLEVSQNLPVNLELGSYELLLNLPDAAPSLRLRHEYAIRLANQDVWETATGFNKLNQSLKVQR